MSEILLDLSLILNIYYWLQLSFLQQNILDRSHFSAMCLEFSKVLTARLPAVHHISYFIVNGSFTTTKSWRDPLLSHTYSH